MRNKVSAMFSFVKLVLFILETFRLVTATDVNFQHFDGAHY